MSKEKKPGWVTAVAIIAIVLSGFGTMGAIQEALTPVMLDAQKAQYAEMTAEFNGIIEQMEQYEGESDPGMIRLFKSMIEMLDKIMNMPDWYKNWLVVAGILGTLINGFYLLGAIFLIQMKPRAIPILYIALPLSIALGISRTLVAVNAFGDTALFLMGGSMIAILIEVILFLVLLGANKSAFHQFEA